MPKTLKRIARKNGFLYVLYNIPRLLKGYYPIFLDYPFVPTPRYGYGKPPHQKLYQLFSADRSKFAATLKEFRSLDSHLLQIPLNEPKESTEPCWINKWLDGLDTLALYGFVALRKPGQYLEIGSGYSTKVVRRAIRDHKLATRITSIDPHPRAGIDAICDQVIRRPAQDVDLKLFEGLQSGDILFVDGSHRSFMNSDVSVFFLDILPNLRPGVLVHIHDIDLPYDYMPEWAEWYYSEQYLLATSLLAGHENFKVVLPNAFISQESDCMEPLESLWASPKLTGVARKGISFWLEIV
ncbi:MAG TPA: class I SAM-dependent methyltransferase [Terriglobales bacterium]|jgi:predicted O-methyltransferase YrrM|nr:class I SAM-dependent methyltransferase [Terriglobales bacterium]